MGTVAICTSIEAILRDIGHSKQINIAFSGGMDSRFLAYVAQQRGLAPHLWHVTGPHIPPVEQAYARNWAHKHGFVLHILPCDPLDIPQVAAGDTLRCYYCKYTLFTLLKKQHMGVWCDGSNASDAQSHRPGARALAELGIYSPLQMAGIDKAQIYASAADLEMDDPQQPSHPCLLTRFPYNMPVTHKALEMIALAENCVHNFLAAQGHATAAFRVRLVRPDAVEIHLLQPLLQKIPLQQRQQLLHELAHIASVPANISFKELETLSGYFDAYPLKTL